MNVGQLAKSAIYALISTLFLLFYNINKVVNLTNE